VRKNQPAPLQTSQRKELVFSQAKTIRRALSFVSQAMLASNVRAASGHETLSLCGGEVGEQHTMPYHGTDEHMMTDHMDHTMPHQ